MERSNVKESVLGYSTPPYTYIRVCIYIYICISGLEYNITLDNILYIKIHFHNKEVRNYSFQRLLELERGLDISVDVNT